MTLISAFSIFDWRLGFFALAAIVILMLISSVLTVFQSTIMEPKLIKYEDTFKQSGVENLHQNQLIRSSFATFEVDKKLQKTTKELLDFSIVSWNSYSVIYAIIMLISIASILVISIAGLNYRGDSNSLILISGLVVSFYNAVRWIDVFGRKVQSFSENYIKIKDLFAYIQNFGKQTYPVLEESNDKLSIS